MNIIESLEWRYATKKMTGEKIPSEKLEIILHAAQLSASSLGLQPYTILVIESDEVKQLLSPAAYNQPQITGSSQLLVFCAWSDIADKDVVAYIENIATKRSVASESLAGFKAMIDGSITNLTIEQKQTWASKQIYIALGITLAAAASVKVDATPMEGFNPAQFDEILGLTEKGLKSVVICALGYRSAEDHLATLPKVRRDKEQLFQFI